jgi:hypothetical protein
MLPIPKFLKTHTSSDTTRNYIPVFTDGSGRGDTYGSIGSWSPNWFGVHNPTASAQSITVWTVDQGTSGDGAIIYLTAGETVYVNVAKIQSTGNITVLGTTNTAGLV